MEDDPSIIVAKRRRTSKNCVGCRKSKVKCDRQLPSCTRCSKLRTPCRYFEVPKDPNAVKFEELQNEIAHLKALLSNRPDINPQASPTESLATSIAQTSPFDHMIGQQNHATLQNDASLENGEFLSANLSGAFPLPQSLSGDTYEIERATCLWTGTQQEISHCGRNDCGHGSSTFYIQRFSLPDAVAGGIAPIRDAEQWFDCFFEGSDRLIPIFSNADTFVSVRERSSLLFDVILAIGCKICSGSNSPQYQSMHRHLRQRVSTHVLSSLTVHSVETVQALLVLACYWEKSWLFMDLALWMTQELKLPDAVEQMMTRMAGEGTNYLSASDEDRVLFQMARVCCGVYILDKIFSLDGGKTSGIASSPNPRRLRCLLSHPFRSAIDFRLLSQVELNSLRAHIHASLTPASPTAPTPTTTASSSSPPSPMTATTLPEHHVATTLRNARLDLSLWLADWTALARTELLHASSSSSSSSSNATAAHEHALNIINLQIQHQWALINAHLKALSAQLGPGHANIAILTDHQRSIVLAAKKAAEAHMALLLLAPADLPSGGGTPSSCPPYLAHFRWATTFVWAKLAFSVLLTLRLALLLGDPVERLVELGGEARRVARELRRVVVVVAQQGVRPPGREQGGGRREDDGNGQEAEYFGILETSVEKFQMAVAARVRGDADAARGRGPVGGVAGAGAQRGGGGEGGRGGVEEREGRDEEVGTQAEADFRMYLPKEFSFDWDFPGLNLQYIPLDWEELFGNFDEII